jgi:hypothetical protein
MDRPRRWPSEEGTVVVANSVLVSRLSSGPKADWESDWEAANSGEGPTRCRPSRRQPIHAASHDLAACSRLGTNGVLIHQMQAAT